MTQVFNKNTHISFLLKLSPDITLKSDYVRKSLIRRLTQNIHTALQKICEKSDFTLIRKYDRLELELYSIPKKQAVIQILQCISGLAFFWEREQFELKDFDDILAHITPKLQYLQNKTFRVSVKRNGKHNFTSNDLARYIGGGLLRRIQGSSVQMKDFDYNVRLEVKDSIVSLLTTRYEAIGGMPIGSEERVVSLISGGYDSSVSTVMMIRKGCPTDFLFFNLGGYDHKEGVKQVSKYIADKYSNGYVPNMIIVPFEKVMQEIIEKTEERYRTIVLKRCMMRTAETLAKKYKYSAIVTGESIAQVSSQTIINLSLIENALHDTPLFRPLLTFNKNEIIEYSRTIGTNTFAEQMPEFCGVLSHKPATRAKREAVLLTEKNLSEHLIRDAVKNTIIEKMDTLRFATEEDIPIQSVVNPNQVIIDLRQPHEIKKKPTPFTDTEITILEIPFYAINEKFKDLDQSKEYVLFCSKGVMSKSHAQDLRQAGFTNVSIFKKGVKCTKQS